MSEVLAEVLGGGFATSRGALNAFISETHRDVTSWGVASICSSALLLLAYSYLPRVRRTPGWHFLYSSLSVSYTHLTLPTKA